MQQAIPLAPDDHPDISATLFLLDGRCSTPSDAYPQTIKPLSHHPTAARYPAILSLVLHPFGIFGPIPPLNLLRMPG